MDEQPHSPYRKTAKTQFLKLDYGMIAADGRHGAFVLIYKRLQRQACFCTLQVPYQVAGLLDGWLHHLQVSFGILLRNHKGRIPDSENIGILRKTVISVHLQAVSRSIGRQSLKAVCFDTGHPEYIFWYCLRSHHSMPTDNSRIPSPVDSI